MLKLSLKKGKESSVLRKHPWVFSGAIQNYNSRNVDGSLAELNDSSGNFLAIGHFQNHGSIALRILSFENRIIDQDFWRERLSNAKAIRENAGLLSNSNNCFRLIHGEGDFLPGLIIDVFGSNAVIQAHSMGMHLQYKEIATALDNLFGDSLQTIYYKSKNTLPGQADTDLDYWIKGSAADTIVKENDNLFKVDWVKGQKTGFFLDQRANRQLLFEMTRPGMSVLNTFCYSGGFSVYALKKDPTKVVSVDASASAIELTKENVSLNKVNIDRHISYTSDTLQYLRQTENFDVIIVDPPAFAKSQKVKHNALMGYKRLNALALSKINPGGLLFTFSCSQAVSPLEFENTMRAAGIESGRSIRILHRMQQGTDHPVSLQHPDGEYLKGLILQVE